MAQATSARVVEKGRAVKSLGDYFNATLGSCWDQQKAINRTHNHSAFPNANSLFSDHKRFSRPLSSEPRFCAFFPEWPKGELNFLPSTEKNKFQLHPRYFNKMPIELSHAHWLEVGDEPDENAFKIRVHEIVGTCRTVFEYFRSSWSWPLSSGTHKTKIWLKVAVSLRHCNRTMLYRKAIRRSKNYIRTWKPDTNQGTGRS